MFRTITFLVFDQFELLDMAGPASVFSTANELSATRGYRCRVVSSAGGLVQSGNGIAVDSIAATTVRVGANDTVLVVGAQVGPLRKAMNDQTLRGLVQRGSRRAERFGSVCSGAFVLERADLLDGRRVTTHWAGWQQLAKRAPNTEVIADALYVQDQRLWTSAGVTAGIDMALEMLRQDHGYQLMTQVAKSLVVYAHRPGNQSQFSELLDVQTRVPAAFAELVDWLGSRLDQPVRVSEMAAYLNLSERTFQRRFAEQLGQTPAKFFEQLRLDSARVLIEAGSAVKVVAARVGFRSQASFRTAFRARYGLTPSMHRDLHQRP